MAVFAKKLRFSKKITEKHRRLALVALLVLFAAFAAFNYLYQAFRPAYSLPEGTAEFHFLDVGQGDSVLIVAPAGVMLIDTGDRAAEKALKNHLDALKIRQIDYAVFTHPHEDHIGNARTVLESYTVRNVILPNVVSTTVIYERMLDSLEKSGANVMVAVSGGEYALGELRFKILAPNAPQYPEFNHYSVVLRVTFGDTAFLLTGDAEDVSEAEILTRYPPGELDCDVLKVGHHGSATATSEAFLSAVTPAVAVISCGKNNVYGHPHGTVLKRLQDIGSTILRTDQMGTIILRTDGNEIRLIPTR